jgi:hypothetical protein
LSCWTDGFSCFSMSCIPELPPTNQ